MRGAMGAVPIRARRRGPPAPGDASAFSPLQGGFESRGQFRDALRLTELMVLLEERMATDTAPGVEAPEGPKERQVILRGEQIHHEGEPGGAIPIPRQLRVGIADAWKGRCTPATARQPTRNRDLDP